MNNQENIFAFQKSEDSTGFLLWQVSNVWQRKMKAGLDDLDLTHVQFVVLASLYWLSMHQESVTQVDIADHAQIDKMMTSVVLRTLQQKGLLTRIEHAIDTRAKSVIISKMGKEVLSKAVNIVEGIDKEFFGILKENIPNFNQNLLTIIQANR